MSASDVPFNVSLLDLTPAKLANLRPVKVLDIFDGATQDFAEDGLYSTIIFGKVGDERRSLRFSYIDIKISIFHPIIWRCLNDLKRMYGGILSGHEYAVWNPEISDFVKSTPLEGETGFDFFVRHWEKIDFSQTDSVRRETSIEVIKKYQKMALTDKVIVMPAGMRDIEIDGGRIKEDEINTFYRKILSISNTIQPAAVKQNPEILNRARFSLQREFNKLYDYLENLIQGKSKLLMGKWASRRIQYGTRNVITSMNTSVRKLGDPGNIGINDTVVGMYQHLKGITPITIYNLRQGFLSKVFSATDIPAKLVNVKTLHQEEVRLDATHFDRWMTDEGLEKILSAFGTKSIRHLPLMIEGRYLGLIYKGPDMTFRLMQDIDELPEGLDKKYVHPLTLTELLYVSTYRIANNYPVMVTRFPITGLGSIYPSMGYMKTTIKDEVRKELGDDWQPLGDGYVAYSFPVHMENFLDSLVIHPAKLGGLGADFDGDTCSANYLYTDESIKEIQKFLNSRQAYIGTNGRFLASADVSTVALVTYNLTKD